MGPTLLAFVTLIVLHNVDGDEVMINPEHVVALQYTSEGGALTGKPQNTLIAKGHKCVVSLSNGKMVSVVEDCGMVRQAINEAQKR